MLVCLYFVLNMREFEDDRRNVQNCCQTGYEEQEWNKRINKNWTKTYHTTVKLMLFIGHLEQYMFPYVEFGDTANRRGCLFHLAGDNCIMLVSL